MDTCNSQVGILACSAIVLMNFCPNLQLLEIFTAMFDHVFRAFRNSPLNAKTYENQSPENSLLAFEVFKILTSLSVNCTFEHFVNHLRHTI